VELLPARLEAASATTEAARNICVTRQVPEKLPLEFYADPARLASVPMQKFLPSESVVRVSSVRWP